MELRRVKLIITLVSFALLMLIVVQVFWAFSSYRLNEKSFHSRTTDAMRKTAEVLNENLTCFEMFSKIPINPHNGFYMIRQKWQNDEFANGPGAMDTVPMYFAHANDNYPFRYDDIKFINPVNLEIVLKFHYLFDRTATTDTTRSIPTGLSIHNFRNKLSEKQSIAERYDTLMLDTILRQELAAYSIDDKFHFGYVRSDTASVEFSKAGTNIGTLLKSPLRVQLSNDQYFSLPYDLVIYFDNYPSLLLTGIRTQLIISFLVVVILLVGFYLFIRIIYRQRKLSELKNDFINNMTHEFKTPLANISVALETLAEQNTPDKEPNSKVYKILGQETERLRENIEKILQIARFEKEKIHFSFEKLDLHNVLQKAASSFEPVLASRKAELKFDFLAPHPVIEADETHLINIICNLIDNSIKYSHNGLQLRIKTENFKEGVLFSVKDNGEGISKEDQKRIFEKFYRSNGGDIHNVKGFGLGLTYVKTIVDSHQGKVSVKSQLNAGTEFEIYLPFNQ